MAFIGPAHRQSHRSTPILSSSAANTVTQFKNASVHVTNDVISAAWPLSAPPGGVQWSVHLIRRSKRERRDGWPREGASSQRNSAAARPSHAAELSPTEDESGRERQRAVCSHQDVSDGGGAIIQDGWCSRQGSICNKGGLLCPDTSH